jgi:hypothetical protein
MVPEYLYKIRPINCKVQACIFNKNKPNPEIMALYPKFR